LITEAAADKHGREIVVLDLRNRAAFTDIFVIVSGDNPPQMQALVDRIEEVMKEAGCRPLGVEGRSLSTWVLLDFDDVIVHVFDGESRRYYDLERFWLDAPRIRFEDDSPPVGGQDTAAVS